MFKAKLSIFWLVVFNNMMFWHGKLWWKHKHSKNKINASRISFLVWESFKNLWELLHKNDITTNMELKFSMNLFKSSGYKNMKIDVMQYSFLSFALQTKNIVQAVSTMRLYEHTTHIPDTAINLFGLNWLARTDCSHICSLKLTTCFT